MLLTLLSVCAEQAATEAQNLFISGSQYTQETGVTNFSTLACDRFGQYTFRGDSLQCVTLVLGQNLGGTFYQSGGSFTVGTVTLPSAARLENIGYGRFSLNGGTAQIGSMTLGYSAHCDQSSGLMNVNALNFNGEVVGAPLSNFWAGYAYYSLIGGVLSASTESLKIGYFLQGGGTNCTESLVLGGDQYWGPGRIWGSMYWLNGGVVVATNVVVGSCSEFHCEGSTGPWGMCNPGTLSLSGSLILGTDSEHFGSLIVTQGIAPWSPTIVQGSGSVLKFENSSGNVWETVLRIQVAAGGDAEFSRIYFGTNSSGLTDAQVGLIQFTNAVTPPFWSTGAMILPTGEVVPYPPPLLWTANGSDLFLRWLGPFILENSDFLEGPYQPLATTNGTHVTRIKSSQFFRLRWHAGGRDDLTAPSRSGLYQAE